MPPTDDDVQWPPGVTAADAAGLQALQAAGWGEGDDGADHHVPADLIKLSEVLEWQAAVEEAQGD